MSNNDIVKMICTICIATYKRPMLLKKLLDSLFEQKLNGGIKLEIIIIDNDVNESAKKICEMYGNTDKAEICYKVQPIQNISLTRNLAVVNATGEYLCFIDDDGYACDTWILELIKCMKTNNADAVFGAVFPYFEEGMPVWIKNSKFFDKGMQNTGESPQTLYTTNCIIRASIIKSFDEPFEPRLGLTGGEDGMLFGKLLRSGAKFVFCAEAVVYDFVPLERGKLKYLVLREFRKGITSTSAEIFFSKNKFLRSVYSLI
jgi:succinoglycan biosynthesis protein ExoM